MEAGKAIYLCIQEEITQCSLHTQIAAMKICALGNWQFECDIIHSIQKKDSSLLWQQKGSTL